MQTNLQTISEAIAEVLATEILPEIPWPSPEVES